jgi:hypothetical protein
MQKHQIHIFVFDSLQTRTFGRPEHLRVTSNQKKIKAQKALRIKF